MLLNGFAQFTASPALDGKSTDGAFKSKNPKPIEMLSFHHDLKRDGWKKVNNTDYLPYDTTHGQVTILKPIDATTVELAKATCLGAPFDKVELICRGPVLEGEQLVQKNLFHLTIESVIISRQHYVGDPRLHVFGRNEGPSEREQRRPILSPEILNMGPLEEVEMLYFGDITWLYAENNAPKSATPPFTQGA